MRSNVLKTPADFCGGSSDKESLRVGHASNVVMSVDGHHIATNPESAQATTAESTSSQDGSLGTCDIALSFADKDKKSAIILKQLLLEKIPSLKISEPISGDFSRVQSLEAARLIVPLLSPAFLASNELVEELNIAIYRNRSSTQQILFPIQVSAIPPKPTYVHLIPCEFSCSDYRWASKIVGENLNDVVFQMAQKYDMDADEVFCLKVAADVISQLLLDASEHDLNLGRPVLLNVRETEEGWKKVQKALSGQQGLEAWKRTFGVEIKSQEDDLKAPRLIQQDEEKPPLGQKKSEQDNVKSVHFEDEGNDGGDGVEFDEKDIKHSTQVEADDQCDALESNPSSSNSTPQDSVPSVDRQNSGSGTRHKPKESSSCSVI